MRKKKPATQGLEEQLNLMRAVATSLLKERDDLAKSLATALRAAADASAAARRTTELLEGYQRWDADRLDEVAGAKFTGGRYQWTFEDGWHEA